VVLEKSWNLICWFFEKFYWIMEGCSFDLFCCVSVNACYVLFSLDYLLGIKLYYVNLSACRLVAYWSIFHNVCSCPRKDV